MIELVLGGARSGKSSYAEQQVINSGLDLLYIATATAGDTEMTSRIAMHQQQRGEDNWLTIEEPKLLAEVLLAESSPDRAILVDCLTLWLSNCLFDDDDQCWAKQKTALLSALPQLKGHVVFVSNEVGQGIIPMGEITRRFVDESGWLHQAVAQLADKVTFVTAGLPQVLKD
ncbi:MAG: bifunctional adenosylcobinamide kinase/adenosylcobinamide-phosphate guanylyltransferase [Pseudomonadales bacterium]|nr:bifunctional adenosylcobinamide kinase/adenosylcobinamide-phosphate guanylyltransferase [Pseudomonadales bacterium]